MRISISLRTRLTFGIILVIGALTVFLSGLIGQHAGQEASNSIGNTLAERAFQMGDRLDRYMWTRSGEVEVLSKLKAIREPEKDMKEVQNLLEQLKKSFPAYSWIGLMDQKGKVLTSTGGILTGADVSARPVFSQGLKRPFVGDVHDAVLLAKLLPNPSGEPLRFVDISTPVYDMDGNLNGVLAAHLSWEWAREVKNTLLAPLQRDKNVEIFVVSSKDNKVLLGNKELEGTNLSLKSLERAKALENSWALEKWPDGKTYLTGFALGKGYMDYKGLGWIVLVRQPQDVAYAPVKAQQNFILLTGGCSALIFALFGWFMSGFIVRPLVDIAKAAKDLQSGGRTGIPVFRGITEIEVLSTSLRNLLASLTKTEDALGHMEMLAQHDRLTGLPNRIALDFFIEQAAKRATGTGTTLTFLYLDLDDFKPVNDTYGHHVGDLLLQEVAARLKKNIRGEDIAARLGGDEFVVVLSTSGDQPLVDGRRVAGRIIADLRAPFFLEGVEGQKIRVGCSVGGAVWPHDGETTTDVMRHADEALYVAKRAGKNRMSFHGTEDHKALVV